MWVNTSKGTKFEQLPHFNFVISRITTLWLKMYMSDSALDVTDMKKKEKKDERKNFILILHIHVL